ncbi:mediator complex subunit [Apophysomyces ossiformis]|uniref:Mediator of RNA polymerase II transcription subunit 5 n=1 Tax=Apophysomyces ossiformis TaxID=679940 RepID=A0A8H7ERA4_9FUNG|nr:mediator complex subunit [Apophysomyces ossiformis]
MSVGALEAVLRYAYVHGYSCHEWAEPTRECFQRANSNLQQELTGLLLSQVFSLTSDPLLESYLTYATTGTASISSTPKIIPESCLISSKVFLSCIPDFVEPTANSQPEQWSHMLQLLTALLSPLDADQIIANMQRSEDEWPFILSRLFIMLARIVAVGLYPQSVTSKQENKLLRSASSFHHGGGNTQPGESSLVWPTNNSMFQATFDPDATIEMDLFEDEDAITTDNNNNIAEPPIPSSTNRQAANAVTAAQIMINLIESKSAKRIFEVQHGRKYQGTEDSNISSEPWATCHAILMPSNASNNSPISQNPHIQTLLLLIGRLTDRDLERQMAVHMKYHELEDEGTARAMPSAGLMGLLYHMVQIRPTLDDEYVINHLVKLQTIKGSFDESFYLELWFTALTGLREASLGTSCQGQPLNKSNQNDGQEKGCTNIVAINRLLWRSLVLVKVMVSHEKMLPYLIQKLQQRKQGMTNGNSTHLTQKNSEDDELNPMESALFELKAFTGLLNACSPPACCSDFYVPASMSSKLVDKLAFGEGDEDDDDDIMKLINDMGNPNELNSSEVIKIVRSISNENIFSNIVLVCERYGFISKKIAKKLMKRDTSQEEIKTDNDEFAGILDTEMLDIDSAESKNWGLNMDDLGKVDDTEVLEQNIEQRMASIRSGVTRTALDELLHIAIVSLVNLRKIIDFLIELLEEKAAMSDTSSIARICDALNACPCMVDLVAQHYPPSALLKPLERVCNEWNLVDNMHLDDRSGCDNLMDEDMDGVRVAYGKFGRIWIFVTMVMTKFKLYRDINNVFSLKDQFCYRFFTQGPVMYDSEDVVDPEVLELINQWQDALFGGDGLPDELLRSATPQMLLWAIPTLIQRTMLAYETGHLDSGVFLSVLSYFQECFLHFTLVPGVIVTSCDALSARNSSVAIMCLEHFLVDNELPSVLIQLCGAYVLRTLASFTEQKTQQRLINQEEERDNLPEEKVVRLRSRIKKMLHMEEDQVLTETVTAGVTGNTLFKKAQEMFRYIVKSGRSMFMRDVDADPVALWDQSKVSKGTLTHYLDMVLFQTALDIGGAHWFIGMIVDQVLEAGKSGGAVRAAELGSCLIATPLTSCATEHNNCFHLLRCLLQDIVPASLRRCAMNNASFFQGQTLGVFISDCLVLMQGDEKIKQAHAVDDLGRQFFDSLVIDGQNERSARQSAFAQWDDMVVKSAVWRGFIKGLMSNPLINEPWPNAFVM